MTFRLLPDGLEEAQFKRQPDGWLFTTANPWVFGRRWNYLVNDEQKAALAARVRRGRYARMILMLIMMAIMVAAFVMAPSLIRPMSILTWLVLGGFVLVFTAAILVSDYLNVRSLLRGIPRTSRKFSQTEMWRNLSTAMSVRAIAIFVAIFVFSMLANLGSWLMAPRDAQVFALITAVMSGVLAAVFAAMLVAKLRARRAAER